jgi:uroporphyrinogen-III synthase
VLVARAAEQSRELVDALSRVALEPVVVPAIAVESDPAGGPLDAAVASIGRYQWVVVTSVNGARAVAAALERTAADATRPTWAAIGDATANVLARAGIRVQFRPTRSDAATIAEELPIDDGDAVLLVRGNLADADLPRVLRERGAVVDDVVAYRTILAPKGSRQLLRDAMAAGPIDALVLTSGSTADGLVALAADEGFDVRAIPAVCIGPETARAATAAGFRVAAMSPSRDVAALARATADVIAPRVMEVVDA